MNLSAYENAVTELSVPKLTEFMKANVDFEPIDGWSKMNAKTKRKTLVARFEGNKEYRKQFVAFYADATGTDADFSEWEQADIPFEGTEPETETVETDAPTETPAAAPAETSGASEVVSGAPPTVPHFVEGAFETIISDVAGLSAVESADNLKSLEDRLEFEHVRLGALLSHIQKQEHFKTLGFNTLKDYVEANTALDYRKAMFLIRNSDTVRELGISAEQLKGVSWSALRHIVLPMREQPSKAAEWLDAARSLTHVALIEQVKQFKAQQAGALPPPDKDGKVKASPSIKSFNLYPDQKATVEQAVAKAKSEANVESTGAALDYIAASYTGKPPSDSSISTVLPDLSEDGLINAFSKLKADLGNDGLMRVFAAIDKVWPDVSINVELPDDETVAAE